MDLAGSLSKHALPSIGTAGTPARRTSLIRVGVPVVSAKSIYRSLGSGVARTATGPKTPSLAHFDSNKKVAGNRPCRNQEKIMRQINQMRSTGWLAQRLGLSVTTIERLRAQSPQDLPPCCTIGKSKRYDEQAVEQWIRDTGRASQAQGPETYTTGEPSATKTLTSQKEVPNDNA